MAGPLRTRRPPRAVTKFSRLAVAAGLGALGLLAVAGMLIPRLWHTHEAVVSTKQPQEQRLIIPEVITRALPLRQVATPAAIVQDASPAPSIPIPDTAQTGILDAINPFAPGPPPVKVPEKQAERVSAPAPPQAPAKAAEVVKTVPEKKRWELLATPDTQAAEGHTSRSPAGSAGFQTPEQGPTTTESPANGLIQPARWAIPANPLQTIYRSQTLAGRLLQAVNSEIPGQVKIHLVMPVKDKFGYNTTILPQDTLIIATQEGRTTYGATRLGLKLEQLELPSGEVIELRATVGDEAGTNGMKGKVNNHYGKLILGTGLSALLNIGVRSAVGTPGKNQFFQDPLQEAAQDVGQTVQRAATDIIGRELQVRPTITIPAGTPCSINLTENMSFSRPPLVAR